MDGEAGGQNVERQGYRVPKKVRREPLYRAPVRPQEDEVEGVEPHPPHPLEDVSGAVARAGADGLASAE